MSAALAVTSSEFEEMVLKSDVPVLVDFWATWCKPCLAIAPTIEELAKEYEGKAKVLKVDVDVDGDLASRFGILGVPSVLLFKGGREVDRITGLGPKVKYVQLIERAL